MSVKAIAIVEMCLKFQMSYVDLGYCGLTDEDVKEGTHLDLLLRQCTHITTLILCDEWNEFTNGVVFTKESNNKGSPNLLNIHPPALSHLHSLSVLACGGNGRKKWGINKMDFVAPLTKLRTLYLGYNNIQKIEGLDRLAYLQNFDIRSNRISELNGLDQHLRLQHFDISNNQVGELKGLDNLTNLIYLGIDNNQINELKGLDKLASLQHFYISSNQVSELKELDNLTNLLYFNINNNRVSELKGLDKLTSLRHFDITHNRIGELKGLDNLTNLRHLGITHNRISKLTGFGNLTKLQHLYVNNNQIHELNGLDKLINLRDFQISRNQIGDLRHLLTLKPFIEDKLEFNFDDNPLVTPPLEIYKQGREAIINYYAQLEKEGEAQYLFEAKLLVIGEGGSGKTSFIRKIQDADAMLPEEKDTTLGIDISKWKYRTDFNKIQGLKEVNFHVNLWDFGGQKIYQGTHQIFFYDKSLYVLVADTREQKTDFSYWLNTVEQLGGEKSILLVVLNKKYGHEVKFDEGYRLHFRDIVKEVISVDLKEDTVGLHNLQDSVKQYLKKLDGIGDPLPPSWVSIREALAEEKKNFISFERFRLICAQFDITDKSMIHTLSGYYNRTGAITHYIDDDFLQDRVYLNSNWLVKTVYKVIDSKTAKKKKGRLSEDEVKSMWYDNELMYGTHQLTGLMHKFGLMYHVPHSDQYVIPAHLPESQPYAQWAYAGASNILQFNYEFEKYMPQGILSHVIVLLHRYIHNELVWHKGVNITYNGAHAEITESLGGKNAFEIRVAGINKRELLTIIRDRFAEVFHPYKNLRYQQKVPCNCVACADAKEKHFYDYSEIIERQTNGKQTIECKYKPYYEVSIKELIDSVDVPVRLQDREENMIISKSKKDSVKKVFISYSHKDEKMWKDPFCNHLSSLTDCGIIEPWHDRYIEPGKWDPQVEKAMNEADVFLLLITVNFLSSGYISTKEITTAYSKYKKGTAIIVPVICTPCKWEIKPLGDGVRLGDFQAYPRDAKPIKNWKSKDDGFLDVINRLEELLGG